MKLKIFDILVFAIATITLASCSPRIAGTWKVQRYETSKPGEQGVSLANVGTIQFKKNGTGKKNIHYNALGVTYNDQKPFKWSWHEEKYVTIEGEGSEFAKTWIIIMNKRKFQKWNSTDGTNTVQNIELSK